MWKSVAAERSREGLAVEQQSPASEFQIKLRLQLHKQDGVFILKKQQMYLT